MADNQHTNDKIRRCSFCGRTERQVEFLIPSPEGICICNDCVNVCADIIDEYMPEQKTEADRKSTRLNSSHAT